ncbi:MAG TPA: hypothetical protein ENN55_04810, partial [Firmicutes bacterium]|nr:hypothetical protein [Bacillota bacterium]
MDRGVLKTVVSGLIMLIFTAVYYLYNPWLSLFAVVVVLILYFRYEGKNYSTVEEGLFCNTMKLFVVFAAVIAAARFINITGYPIDFYTDEWNEISGAYFRLSGDREFLAYNSRFGSSLLYFSLGVITAVMALFRENLDMLRLIPAVVSVLTALAFYFLGAVLKNKKLGVVWAFLFLSSCWALFLSRKLMENIYIPFFAVLVLVLFFAYIRTGRFLMLAAAGVLWFLALYTYSSWLLSIPMAVYLCFEYRKELGHKKLVGTAIFMVAALVLYSLAPGGAGETQEWALRNTVFQKGGQVLAVFVNIKNIFIYLFTPFEYTHLSHTLPAVSASGALLLAGGIAEAVRSRDNRTSRFFLFGLLISMATLVICEDPAHNLRHVMMLPFIVMLSGIFLNRMLRWKYLYVFIALHICLFSGSLFYHLTVWGTQMNISGKEMAVSAHINSICKDDYI